MSGMAGALARRILVVSSFTVLLLAWMLSTPAGGYPDDSFHFANTWCDEGLPGFPCSDVEGTPSRNVPNVFTDGSPWWITTGYGTNLRQPTEVYPGLYYGVMRLFAGESVVRSVVAMRVFNVALAIGLASLAYWVIAPRRRFALLASWLFAGAGLGFFYLSSNHPIGWLVLGAATGWAFVNALVESNDGRRRIVTASGLAISLAIMLGSRPEGQLASVLVVLVGLTTADWDGLAPLVRRVVPRSTSRRLVAAVGSVGVVALIVATLGASTINRVVFESLRSVFSSGFLSRAIDVPYTYMLGIGSNAGSFYKGSFGAQSAFLLVAIAGAAAIGLRRVRGFRAMTLGVLALAAFWAPLSLGDPEISVISTAPRYMLVFLALFLATALAEPTGQPTTDDRVGWWILGSILAVGHALALHGAIRIYEVDTSQEWRIGLNAGLKWWWQWGPSPQSTWLIGSAAFAVLVGAMMSHHPAPRTVERS